MPRYAHFNPAISPSPILGWYDTDVLHYPNLPSPDALVLVTDEQWQEHLEDLQGWVVHDGQLAKYEPPPPGMQDRLAELATYRYGREVAGVDFTMGDGTAFVLPTDRATQGVLTSLYTAAQAGLLPSGTVFKSQGAFYSLTSADVIAAAMRALSYVQSCFAREAVLAAALAQDISTDITVGWPS